MSLNQTSPGARPRTSPLTAATILLIALVASLLSGVAGGSPAAAQDAPAEDAPAEPSLEFVESVVDGGPTDVRSIATGDFNQDGYDDAAFADATMGIVGIWLNPAGEDEDWQLITVADGLPGVFEVAVTDFDGDGDLDIASAAPDGGHIHRQDGSATAATFMETDGTTGWTSGFVVPATAIATHEATNDVVAVKEDGTLVRIWYDSVPLIGAPKASVETLGRMSSADPVDVTLVDVDGDGCPDAVTLAEDGAMQVFTCDYQSGDEPTTHQLPNDAVALAGGDLDGDGDQDVAANVQGSSPLRVINGDGSSWVHSPIDDAVTNSQAIAVDDLDGDGSADIVLPDSYWLGTEGGSQWDRPDVPWARGVHAVGMLDANPETGRDVIADLEGRLTLYSPADGGWYDSHRIGAFAQDVRFAEAVDLNGDDRPEIVVQDLRRVLVYHDDPSASGWTRTVVLSNDVVQAASLLVLADVDTDGDSDIVFTWAGGLTLLLNGINGTAGEVSSWTSETQTFGDDALRSVFYLSSGDFNGDGLPDLAFQNTDGTHALMQQAPTSDGPGQFSLEKIQHRMVSGAVAADVDGDGRSELVTAQFNRWFEFDPVGLALHRREVDAESGEPIWRSQLIADDSGANDLHAADANGDGFIDIISAGTLGPDLIVHRNPGPANAANGWSQDAINDITGPPHGYREAHTGDIDGDGRVDLVAALMPSASGDQPIHVFLGMQSGSLMEIEHSTDPDGVSFVPLVDDGAQQVLVTSRDSVTLLSAREKANEDPPAPADDPQPTTGAAADLSVTGAHARNVMNVTVTNDGPASAGGQVVITVPQGLSLTDLPTACARTTGGASCAFDILSDGQHETFDLRVDAEPGTHVVPLRVHGSASDPQPGNNSATVEVVIEEQVTVTGEEGDPIAIAIGVSQERFDDAHATGGAFAQTGGAKSDADPIADWVVLANDRVFADALGGSVLTGTAPLLLTGSDAMDSRTLAEIERVLNGDGRIYVLGGDAAISSDITDGLEGAGYEIVRLSGDSRVETALAIADEARRIHVTDEVLLARADSPAHNPTAAWADAISAGGHAAATGSPILLTQTSVVHPAVAEWLSDNGDPVVTLLGGEAALSTQVQVGTQATVRVAGGERQETAVEVARLLRGVMPRDGSRGYLLVNGHHPDGWAHGLAAAGLSADTGQPVLLVATTSAGQPVRDEVAGCADSRVQLTTVGTDEHITPSLMAELDALDDRDC